MLNETISLPSTNLEADFTSNNTQYRSIERNFPELIYRKSSTGGDAVYTTKPANWYNEAYRTLTFATPPTGDLLTWLQANGTKQGGGGQVTPKLTKGTWRWLTPWNMAYESLKEQKNNTTVTEFTSGGKTFTGFEYDAPTGNVAYSSNTEYVDVIVNDGDAYVDETYKDITVTQDFDLEEDDFLYQAIAGELLTKLS